MPIIKVSLEVEVFAKSENEIVEATNDAIEKLYNTAYDWIENKEPPIVNTEVIPDINLWAMYIDKEWHA